MTQEEKQLLFIDLCGRFPYHPFIYGKRDYAQNDGPLANITSSGCFIIVPGGSHVFYLFDEFKPYLRPMSSMTKEENKEFALLQTDFYVDGFLYPIAAINMVNWLNSHHFDYRGLIEKGLALEAPKDMYKTE